MKMQHVYVAIACLWFIPFICRAETALRTFSTPDGRSLEARILEHSESNGKIQLERSDGRKIWILPSVFAEGDQEYIRQWIAADQFMSSMKFKISGESSKDHELVYEEARDGSKVRSSETTDVTFTINLHNRTDYTLPDLKLEYRAFIHTKGYEGKEDSDRVEGDLLTVGTANAGEEVTQTIEVRISTKYVTVTQSSESFGGTYSYTYYGKKTYEDDLKGFWIRVYGPSIDGRPTFREWCYPSDTMDDFQWQKNVSHRR